MRRVNPNTAFSLLIRPQDIGMLETILDHAANYSAYPDEQISFLHLYTERLYNARIARKPLEDA